MHSKLGRTTCNPEERMLGTQMYCPVEPGVLPARFQLPRTLRHLPESITYRIPDQMDGPVCDLTVLGGGTHLPQRERIYNKVLV